MKKNVAGQKIGAQLVSATDGSAFTGSVTVSVTVDAGTQATGSVGSGACTHEGNGYHTYAPAQAETNGDLVAFTFTGTGAVPTTVQVYTRPTTGLLAPTVDGRTLDVSAGGEAGVDWANVGSPTTTLALTGTTIATTQKVDIETIKTNPVVNAGTITFPTGATLASTTNITAGTITTATNVTTVNGLAANVITASSINTGAITSAKFAAGAIDAAAIATNAIDADALAADAIAEINATVDTALADVRLDELLAADSDIDGAAPPTVGSVFHELMTKTAGSFTYDQTTDSLEAVRDRGDSAWITATSVAVSAGGITSASFGAGAINAAAIATDAIDADALAADAIAEINATVDTALADINLDHLVKNAVDTNFATTVHLDSVVGHLADAGTTATFDRTTDALEVLGAATAPSAATIADAVWDEAIAGHLSAGSTGEALNAAGAAGDPWTTTLPGAYGAGSAGYIVGTNIDALISSRMATYTQPTGFLAATFPGTVASTTNITAGTITTVTNVTTVNGLAANVITAAATASDFGTEIGTAVWATTTRQLTGTQTFNLTGNVTGNLSGSVGSVTDVSNVWSTALPGAFSAGSAGYLVGNYVDTAISDVNSNVLALPSAVNIADAVWVAALPATYTAGQAGYILANAGGGSLTAGAIADAVWDEAISGHLTSGTTGNKLNAASSAGDPWSTALPGGYTGTEAGFILGTLRASTLSVNFPLVSTDNSLSLVIGDDYYAADSRGLSFNYGASPSLSGATVRFKIQLTELDTGYSSTNTYTSVTGTVSGTTTQVIAFDIPGTATDDCSEDWHDYEVEATLSNARVVTLIRGRVNMLSQVL